MFYADLTGLPEVYAKVQALHAQHGKLWEAQEQEVTVLFADVRAYARAGIFMALGLTVLTLAARAML